MDVGRPGLNPLLWASLSGGSAAPGFFRSLGHRSRVMSAAPGFFRSLGNRSHVGSAALGSFRASVSDWVGAPGSS